jgi:hypothetical protein
MEMVEIDSYFAEYLTDITVLERAEKKRENFAATATI